jgi:hypothetical protein
MSKREIHGASIETRDDGTTSVRTAGGGVIDVDQNRNVKLDLATIEAVGIHNVIEVESHQINRVLGSTSHYIRFHGGGEVRFAYNDQGKLIELSARSCGFSLTNKNELFFHRAKKSG